MLTKIVLVTLQSKIGRVMKYNLELVISKLESEDKSLKQICRELSYPYVYISRLLVACGVSCRSREYSKVINKELAEELFKRRKEGIPIQQLANEYGCAVSTIAKAFKRFNLDVKPYLHLVKDLNHDFFRVIDTEEKAYLLGFFAADGTISKKHSCMALLLQERDVEILDYYKLAFNSKRDYYSYPATKKSHSNRLKICIDSPINKQNLLNLGFPPDKTHKMFALPDEIMDKELYRHFIRGYFDGDGSIILPSKNSRVIKLKITSTNVEFLKFCMQQFEKELCYNIKIETRANNLARTLYIQNKPSIRILFNYFYNDAHYYLQRKYTKMKSVAQLESNLQ